MRDPVLADRPPAGSPSDPSVMLALDIGGTKTAAARVDSEGVLTDGVREQPTPADEGPGAVLDAAADLLRGLDPGSARAVAVSCAGVVDAARGRVVAATSSITGWAGTEVAAGLHDRLGLPVHVIGDGHAFALGEARHGLGRGRASVLVLAVGTGVGGGFVRDDAPWLGEHHAAGHVGHVAVPQAVGRRCPCGRTGHLEAVASGSGILAWYHDHGGDPAVRTTHELVGRPDDAVADAALTLGATALGTAAAGLVNVLDPALVVVAGGLSRIGPRWERPLEAAFRDSLLPLLEPTPLEFSAGGAATALRGAVSHAVGRRTGNVPR